MTAAVLLAALFFAPLVRMAGTPVRVGEATLYPVVAPALIVVGSFMVRAVAHIDFPDPPAAGRAREVHPVLWACALLFAARYAFL